MPLEPIPLPPGLAAPAVARRHVAAALARWPADERDIAILLASELVTNAVRHGAAPVTIATVVDGDEVRIEVADADPAQPQPGSIGGDLEGGRGLAMVAAMSDAWGCQPGPAAGKIMWFALHRDSHR